MFQRNDPLMCTKIVCKKASKFVKPGLDKNGQDHKSKFSLQDDCSVTGTPPLDILHENSQVDRYINRLNYFQTEASFIQPSPHSRILDSAQETLRNQRLSLHISPQELKSIMGVTPSSNSALFNGNSRPLNQGFLMDEAMRREVLTSTHSLLNNWDNRFDTLIDQSYNLKQNALKEASQFLHANELHGLSLPTSTSCWNSNVSSFRQAMLLSRTMNGQIRSGNNCINSHIPNAHAA